MSGTGILSAAAQQEWWHDTIPVHGPNSCWGSGWCRLAQVSGLWTGIAGRELVGNQHKHRRASCPRVSDEHYDLVVIDPSFSNELVPNQPSSGRCQL
jgi:hypothetical protein